MLWRHVVLTLAIGLVAINQAFAPAAERKATSAYPDAPTDGTVDEYHGTRVPDPYRPLEDPDAPESRAWIEAENKITFAFLEGIAARKPLHGAQRVAKAWLKINSASRHTARREIVELNGQPGLVVILPSGVPSVLAFTVDDGRIVRVDVVRNPEKVHLISNR